MICNALKVGEGIGQAWAEVQRASSQELERFQQDSRQYGPTLSAAKLDTSGPTAAKAKLSDWNLILVSVLAEHAESQAAQAKIPAEYGYPSHQVSWGKLISSRINRILDDIYSSRQNANEDSGALEGRMHLHAQANRIASRKRATRSWVCECHFISAGSL